MSSTPENSPVQDEGTPLPSPYQQGETVTEDFEEVEL